MSDIAKTDSGRAMTTRLSMLLSFARASRSRPGDGRLTDQQLLVCAVFPRLRRWNSRLPKEKTILLAVAAFLWIAVFARCAKGEDCGTLTPYQCALSDLRQLNTTAAIEVLRQHLKREPGDLRSLNLLGIALTAAHDVPDANREFEVALRDDPRFYPALKNLAVNEFNSGDISRAKMHFQQVLELEPDDEISHLFLGNIAFASRECTLTLEHYDKSRDQVVKDPSLVLRYVQCSLEQSHTDAALNMLQRLPESDAKSNFDAGLLLGRAGDFREAAHHFELSRQGYPDPYTAGYNQTLMMLKAGDYPGAIGVANDLLGEGYRKAELYNLLSEAYAKNNQVKEAYDSLRTATEIDPEDENNYVDLSSLCLDHENFDLGIEIADIGLRHIPNSERLYLQRGVLREEKGQTKESEQDFLMASKIAPDKALPYVALGIAWMEMDEFQKSIQLLRGKALSDPTDFMIPYLYGEALVRSGVLPESRGGEEALESFRASVRLNPNFVHARTELGKLLLKRGKVNDAVLQLEKAVSLDPKDVAAAFQLAQAYKANGDNTRAQEMIARVGKLHVDERTPFTNKDLIRIIREGTVTEAGSASP